MAAYAALVSLARAIDQILHQDQQQDYAFLCDKEQMKSLHEKIIRLQEFLEYISVKSPSSTVDDVLLLLLESRIRDVAYQLEDIIESIICRSLGQEFESDDDDVIDTQSSSTLASVVFGSVAKIFSCLQGLPISCIGGGSYDGAGLHPSPWMAPLCASLCNCIEEIDIILKEATRMKKKHVNKYVHSSTTTNSSRDAPTAKGTNVGLNKDLTQILDRITGQGSKLQIVPITGMGGIGKTTLARAVYEDSRMLHRFDVRLWVTVSQDYAIQDVLRGLLPAAGQKQPDEKLIEHVHKSLKGRRFLIVLDDMWHEKAWDGVMNALPDDNNGSRIILTTRILRVASYVGSSSHVHEMQLLNEDQSWILLREKVYGHEPCPPEFEDIGKTISRNCKGLPLAVVVVGGILRFNKTKHYWEEVAENTNTKAVTDHGHLFEILSLSYTNLPPHLKTCFLYMGAFPEDYEIQTEQLVMLWTAEGFLKPRESMTMEEVAEECLEDLVERSLVLVMERRYNGKIETSNIHDVLREVSIRKAREEKFLHCYRNTDDVTFRNTIKDQRRVSFNTDVVLDFQYDTYDLHVRSLLYTNSPRSQWVLNFQHLKLLRVLHGQYIKEGSIFTGLCRLTNLRYLHLVSSNPYKVLKIPGSISKLQNLETFIIRCRYWAYDNMVLPLEIWKLPRLRHLVLVSKNTLQFPLSRRVSPVLKGLQTLYGLRNINFSRSVIERIPNVKKLTLHYRSDDDVKYWHRFSVRNLQHLHQLEELSIFCDFEEKFDDGPWPTGPTDFRFPHSLKTLLLKKTHISSYDMSIFGSLPNLEVLELMRDSIVGFSRFRTWKVQVEMEFLQLKYLKMEDLSMESWTAESTHFPRLQELVIVSCRYLEEVPESIGEIDTLQKLIVKNCPEATKSVRQIQENQENFGNDSLEIILS